ncbi:Fanconi anemia group J protein homolog isoform X2 [Apis mellifera]|uniref:DNA 5'-3' helicase n=1 Tax=Apis mellifera TaxID=7460 RepID=A0A7M7MKT9_APIME|nr:Fanconi anemia group J protein homolog isoform X2 [Apis mellifera]|eukprot:XP_026297465.1 Fanconi anemia group J protein homolog isoform X2 [Apis mellifera]
MLVICVIIAVFGYITYTIFKIKIEEWLEEANMNKLSLKRHHSISEESQNESFCSKNSINNIEVTSDESDNLQNNKGIESEKKSTSPIISNENYDEKTRMSKFQQSTDSVESNEDDTESMFLINSKISMFNWSKQRSKTNLNTNNVGKYSDSDSSDKHTSTISKRKRKYKKKKEHKEKHFIKKEDTEVEIQHELLISGIKVKLPVKPYSCQVAVMNKLIQGCIKGENCLLESPTGSGKTLALLCGVLAWHDHYIAEMDKKANKLENVGARYEDVAREGKQTTSCENNEKDCCEESSKKCMLDSDDSYEDYEDLFEDAKGMTILSSREYTCIQNTTKNKTELCNELLDTAKHKGCPYYNETNKKTIGTFWALEKLGLRSIWDIEDLVNIGKDKESCPYFAARTLMDTADIIFCPYNYIIDPNIRESLQLDMKDQVIILDEAHNIEDISRDVSSVAFREDHLQATAHECETLAKQRAEDFMTYDTLKTFLLKLVTFLKDMSLDKVDYNNENRSSKYWTGAELAQLFNMKGLNETVLSTFLMACNKAISDLNKAKEDNRMYKSIVKPIISSSTKMTIENLMYTIRMITSKEYKNDYRACVIENTVKDFKHISENAWMSVKKYEQRVRTLKLVCMNPGVAFSPLALNARCIILASGTLTPTTSFQSELGTSFTHVLNTGHVIPKEQVYATCIPKGPNGILLKANYQIVNTWQFQDELGQVLLDVCESIPHGILCFFSSYNVMNIQMERWKQNSIWSKITSVKTVFIEPRHGGGLTDIMNEYREVIEYTSSEPKGRITGALFLAVFRGKVAEGIDFRDNEARCVITVGIPYAVRKDPVIDMKMTYNDMNVSKGLLRGSEWYSIQAYRALNQALGRCLRHIHDWGAVLLVDERFLVPQNKENLPKWVKSMWIKQNEYDLKRNLKNFVEKQKARENKEQNLSI